MVLGGCRSFLLLVTTEGQSLDVVLHVLFEELLQIPEFSKLRQV